MEVSSNVTGSQNIFTPDDSLRDNLGFKPKVLIEEYSISDYLVNILSFDDIFLETYLSGDDFRKQAICKNS